MKNVEVIDEADTFVYGTDNEIVTDVENIHFPSEYAVSGWFKWKPVSKP